MNVNALTISLYLLHLAVGSILSGKINQILFFYKNNKKYIENDIYFD